MTRCILIPTGPGIDATHRCEAALRLGRRLHAHLDVVFIGPSPAQVLAALPGLPVDEPSLAAIEEGQRLAAADGRAALAAWCARAGIPLAPSREQPAGERLDATFATWTELQGEVEPLLTLAGRVRDLVVVDRPDPDRPFLARALDTALFAVGRPALVVGDSLPSDLLRHVAIAWNGSLEVTRLIGLAMPLLHEAGRVTVLQAESGRLDETRLADLCAYLRWHGIVAEPVRLPAAGEAEAGAAILSEAARRGATLIALGAYSHSRVRQFLLGGVTRHVLAQGEIAALMIH